MEEHPRNVKKQRKQKFSQDEADELEAIALPQVHTIYDTLFKLAEKAASTRVGQYIINTSDHWLSVIESTTRWSIPPPNATSILERPLPWIPFLMLITILRITRFSLSLGAILIGNPPITARDMVYFIQIRRRKLRAIRVTGLREMRLRRNLSLRKRLTRGLINWLTELKERLTKLFNQPEPVQKECKPLLLISTDKQLNDDDKAPKERKSSKRPRNDEDDDECSNLDLTVDEMLNKYANESSDDSDFIPNSEELNLESEDNTFSATESAASSTDEENETQEQEDSTESSKQTETNAENSSQEKEEGNSKDDANVEIKENGQNKHKESETQLVVTEVDSGNEQVVTPTNTDIENPEEDIARKQSSSLLNLNKKLNQVSYDEEVKISSSGYENEANAKLEGMIPAITLTSFGGSPPDFNACFKPVSILKNSTKSVNDVNAPSCTQTVEEPIIDNENVGSIYEPPQRPPQRQQPRYRYRGKNRR